VNVQEVSIGELCDSGAMHVQTGPFGSQLHSGDYREQGTYVIPTEAIGRRKILNVPLPRVDAQVVARLARHQLRSGDILFARRGAQATGLSAIVEENHVGSLCGTGAILLRVADRRRINPSYLSLALSCDEAIRWIKDNAIGAVMPNLNTEIIRRIRIPLPSREEQCAIAVVASALDDKVELNRRMNETLEEMTRALFKSWFVDFDPVHAKAAGKRPFGLDEARSSLFPARFQTSELGRTPNGWRVTTLGEYVSLERGTTYKSSLLGLPGPYLLGLGSMQRNGGFRGTKLKTYGGESGEKLILRPGDLYASLKDVTQAGDLIGAVARVPRALGVGRLTQDTVKLNLVDPMVPSSFIYWSIRDERCREYCRSRAIGTTNLSLARLDFLSFPVLRPTTELLLEFAHTEQALIQRYEVNDAQSATLAAVRDALLPKLLSGELRIKDAEKFVGEAT
jgi:type I restriction enzyme S subunit